MIKELLKPLKLDWVNEGIDDENFPDDGVRGQDHKIFHFDESLSSEVALERMDKEGYRPMTIHELLEWAPAWNGEDFVAALGSIVKLNGGRRVACLGRGDRGRGLSLDWFGGDWGGDCRFAGVKKAISQTDKTMWNQITETTKKTSELIAECRALFPVYVYAEENVDKNFPVPKESTRTFKPNIEADPEHKNKSYNEITKAGIQGITLRERLIMELQYFQETRKHLDIDSITLTTSLCSGDYVARVGWDVGRLYVGGCSRDRAVPHLRVREVGVPLSPSSLNPSEVEVTELRYKGKLYRIV